MKKVLIFAATYNESENIEDLISEFHQFAPDADVLVIDDNSPDGTGDLLKQIMQTDSFVNTIHRPSKLGLGSAHKLAMKYMLANGYDYLITLDADFSHNPKYLPVILECLENSDFVIGSRYIEGGVCDYGLGRTLISKTANSLARLLLGLKLRETTTSYRGFSRNLLSRINIDAIKSEGYSFFVESIFCVARASKKLSEFPIHFEDRRAGVTKISKTEIYKGVLTLFRLFFSRFFSSNRQLNASTENVEIEDLADCEVCGSPFHSELYLSTASTHESEKFNCSSEHHGSHGRIVKCLQCGIVYTNPRLPEDKMLALYADVDDDIYLENIDAREVTFSYNLKKILPFVSSRGKLLEVGSYYGVALSVAKEYGYDVYGVEPSSKARQMAKEKFGVNTLAPTLAELEGYESEFDIVTSWDVLEHMVHPMKELALVSDKLQEGGVFAFSTLDFGNWYPKLLGEKWPWMMDMHIYYFDQKDIKYMLQKSGMELVHTESYCHIITASYFFGKLASLNVPGAKLIERFLENKSVGKTKIPFSFGDIQLYVAVKK